MTSRTQPASGAVYEDFEPLYEWDRDQRLVKVMLPGKCILNFSNLIISTYLYMISMYKFSKFDMDVQNNILYSLFELY